MNCLKNNPQGADILLEYLGGTLAPELGQELERHMETCAECRHFVNVWNSLDEFAAPEVSPDFDAKLYARIAQESRLPWWRKLFWPAAPLTWWKPAIPVAAACAALAFALLIRGPQPAPATKAQADTVSIEQVEQALEDLDLLAPVAQPAQL